MQDVTIAEFNKDDELSATIVSLMNKIGKIYQSYFPATLLMFQLYKSSIVVVVLCPENISKYVKFTPP